MLLSWQDAASASAPVDQSTRLLHTVHMTIYNPLPQTNMLPNMMCQNMPCQRQVHGMQPMQS